MFKFFGRSSLTLLRKKRPSIAFQFLNTKAETPSMYKTMLLKRKPIGVVGWMLLVIPGASFALGTWQVKRKKWKEDLIARLETRASSQPIALPYSLEEVNELEYYPVHVRGEFLHNREVYIGPRTLISHGDSVTSSSLFTTSRQSSLQGYLVVTPFKLADRDEIILVNRGWVPSKNKDPRTRVAGQVQGQVDVIGLIRLHENRPQFSPANRSYTNCWIYRDLKQMCEVTGASPIFLDATDDFNVKDGPIGGQTRITMRNEHLSYILTWYSLCAFTSFMWYKQFIKGVSL